MVIPLFQRRMVLTLLVVAGVLTRTPTQGAPPHHAHRRKVRASRFAASKPLAVVAAFEVAYHNKDKQTMIQKLMVPTKDDMTLEKRYQWLRGYGPHDMPGSAHPPILFESSKGSFVPDQYAVKSVVSRGTGRVDVTVGEIGTYRDEDGRYKVIRDRLYKLQQVQGRWYVMDYVLKDNQEDYGFYADDIYDKMTLLGK